MGTAAIQIYIESFLAQQAFLLISYCNTLENPRLILSTKILSSLHYFFFDASTDVT